MRKFSNLLSTSTRPAEALCRHISTICRPFDHHEGGGSSLVQGPVNGTITSSSPSLLPFIRGHGSTSMLKLHQQHGLLSRHLFHTNASVKQPLQAKMMEIEIISEENIKPSSPTPNHLKTFKLSILDQFFFPIHTPCILYFHNRTNTSLDEVISDQSKSLKTSLSQLLTRFYPLAGRLKDDYEIDCNDQGVHFTEARVNINLLDFLSQPDDHLIQGLIPRTLGNYVVSIQVNIFDCGGIALSTSVSHKLIDGTSYFTFLKAWAATMRGSCQVTRPSFIASTLFPQSRDLKNSLPTKLVSRKNTITKRFVLSASALASLKAKVANPQPTRVEAASSLIWKCAAKAACGVRSFGQNSPYALFSFVDIRRRDSPKLPDESIGNLIVAAVAVCFPKTEPELGTLMGEVKKSFASVNYDLFSKFKGEKGYVQVDGLLKMCNDLFAHIDEGDCLVLTSLCKSGLYEIDFGWGKPIWFSYINPGVSRIVALADTSKGDGIEATVSLSPQEMAIFERDEELLSYASMDYSPLKLFGIDSYISS